MSEHAFVAHDPNHKGNVAESVIATEAIKLGIPVLRPMQEHTRYDLLFEIGGRFLRVQCKSANLHGDVVIIHLSRSRVTSRG